MKNSLKTSMRKIPLGIQLFVIILFSSANLLLADSLIPNDVVTKRIEQQRQKHVVQGTVKDKNGEPVIGAVIMEKGVKNNGTTTDVNGHFTLSVSDIKSSIQITFLGFQTQEVAVPASGTLNIVMKENIQKLDEVIVVAFGKQKREAFTGSAAVVKSDAITERQVTNPIAALNGKVTGVQMYEGNAPNSNPVIRIRGISSINAGNDPLIIVDGLPYSGYWNDINPADVESVTVQKDAASNALYGARGANGVIMVTTKNASKGKSTISFDAKWGVNTDGRVNYDYISDPGQYYEAYYLALYNYYRRSGNESTSEAYVKANEALGKNTNEGGLGYIVYTVPEGQALIGENGRLNPNATLGKIITYNGQDYTIRPDNWRDHGLRNGFREEYNLNINGGTDRFAFYGSLGYMKNNGLTYGSDYERYTTRMKADYNARPWLRIGGNIAYTHNESNAMASSFAVSQDIAPIYPLFIRDGKGNVMTDRNGPLYDYGDGSNAGLQRSVYQSINPVQADLLNNSLNNSNSFNVQGYMNISFLKDFILTLNASIFDTENRATSATNPFYGNNQDNGIYTAQHYRTYSANYQQLLNYNKAFGLHTISTLLGHEYTRNTTTSTGGTKTDVFSYFENQELDGAIKKGDINGSSTLTNREGYFIRTQYDYANTYFFSASYRRDGSSTFHPDYRWGNFWSVSGAWILTKEHWLENSRWLNLLKIKLSYGEQGNDAIGNYRYADLYNLQSVNDELSLTFTNKGKKDISWEKNGTFNAGIEFGVLNQRLTGNIEYYNRKTSGMLAFLVTPSSLGYDGYYDNVGDMTNKGWEIDLTTEIIQRPKLNWSLNVNLSHNKNEVAYLHEDRKHMELDGYKGYLSGYYFFGQDLPLYSWRLKKYAGVSAEGKSQWYFTDKETGEQKKTTSYDKADYYMCGNAQAKLTGGFGSHFSFAGLDLSINFLYSLGGKALDYGYQTLMSPPSSTSSGRNFHKDILKSWSENNPNSNIPCWEYNERTVSGISDRWLTDASTLTLKNISLGYTLPLKFSRKLTVSKIRVYFACDNVAYWSKRKGFDPRSSLNGSVTTGGYSPMRTISGGINIEF